MISLQKLAVQFPLTLPSDVLPNLVAPGLVGVHLAFLFPDCFQCYFYFWIDYRHFHGVEFVELVVEGCLALEDEHLLLEQCVEGGVLLV